VLVPGERITQGAIDYIRSVLDEGGFISGASDASMDTVLVMSE
jgi:arginine/lysine/ornithine decarboxylase